ncbi:MAG: hypothetical protein ACK5PF_11510 [bacterium]
MATRLGLAASVAGRVFAGRYHPVDPAELPCWVLRLDGELVDAQALGYPSLQSHAITLQAKGYVRSTTDLEAAMDAMQAEALAALFGTEPPYSLRCSEVQRVVNVEADASVGFVTLTLDATVLTLINQPETIQ